MLMVPAWRLYLTAFVVVDELLDGVQPVGRDQDPEDSPAAVAARRVADLHRPAPTTRAWPFAAVS
jgi:hypothetical protein